ncbi:MAG: GPR endopeptidase [Clostridiales bacterium]|nr:GPR endopeptidase [Clostridiales bacterium]
MNFRTDLALERANMIAPTELEGVETKTNQIDNATITSVEVKNEKGAQTLGKPIGKYITIEIPPFTSDSDFLDGRLTAVTTEIKRLLPDGEVLVIGLGNRHITPDAFGPDCANEVIATRHISKEVAKHFGLGDLRSVSTLSPGVLGQTGLETVEIIRGLVDVIKPSAILTIDALSAKEVSRLGCTVQITDTGISPGSGVGNTRCEISQKTLGVPVISLGVPTVVDGMTLCTNLIEPDEEEEDEIRKKLSLKKESNLIVTPAEVDLLIEKASRFVALAINSALQPHLKVEEILSLIA